MLHQCIHEVSSQVLMACGVIPSFSDDVGNMNCKVTSSTVGNFDCEDHREDFPGELLSISPCLVVSAWEYVIACRCIC